MLPLLFFSRRHAALRDALFAYADFRHSRYACLMLSLIRHFRYAFALACHFIASPPFR